MKYRKNGLPIYTQEEREARWELTFTLHWVEGYTCAEIGRRLGVTGSRVRELLHQAHRHYWRKAAIEMGCSWLEARDRCADPAQRPAWMTPHIYRIALGYTPIDADRQLLLRRILRRMRMDCEARAALNAD